VSETEQGGGSGFGTAAYLRLIEQEVRESKEESQEGERIRMVVCTPEGRIEALQLDCVDPNLLVVRGLRGGRPTRLITTIEAAQVYIERVQPPPEEKPRPIGFRILD
jgi:hypothetical protein